MPTEEDLNVIHKELSDWRINNLFLYARRGKPVATIAKTCYFTPEVLRSKDARSYASNTVAGAVHKLAAGLQGNNVSENGHAASSIDVLVKKGFIVMVNERGGSTQYDVFSTNEEAFLKHDHAYRLVFSFDAKSLHKGYEEIAQAAIKPHYLVALNKGLVAHQEIERDYFCGSPHVQAMIQFRFLNAPHETQKALCYGLDERHKNPLLKWYDAADKQASRVRRKLKR